jgi:hypothetical protein
MLHGKRKSGSLNWLIRVEEERSSSSTPHAQALHDKNRKKRRKVLDVPKRVKRASGVTF